MKITVTPDNKKKTFMFIGDFLILIGTVVLIIQAHNFLVEHEFLRINRPLKPRPLSVCPFIYLLVSYIFAMYDMKKRETLKVFTSLLSASFLSFCVVFGLAKVLRANRTTMIYALIYFFIISFLLLLWRLICRRIFIVSRHYIKQKVLFVSSDPITGEILSEIKHCDYKVLGILAEEKSDNIKSERGLTVLGSWNDLLETTCAKKPDIVVVAMDVNLPLSVIKNMYKARFNGIRVYNSDIFFEILTGKVSLKKYLEDDQIPYLDISAYTHPVFNRIKRIIDIFGATFLLVFLSPFFLAIMVLIKLTSKGPSFFVQQRVSFQEKSFRLIKFRTMKLDAEAESGPCWATKEDDRTTRIGRLLRKSRLDELPQLINVLKGDMSFVGPRPIRCHFANIIEEKVPFYTLRFSIKPGLTGWAQVNYHYGGTLEGHIEKFQYDLYYIKHASQWLDFFIVLKTIQTILCRPAY